MATADYLKTFLGDTYALMIKTHAFHWNVTGPNFRDLHKLFEEQYRKLFEATDVIVERIRAMGHFPPGGTGVYARMSSIEDPRPGLNAEGMLEALSGDHAKLGGAARKGISLFLKEGDNATADILTGRQIYHEKQGWTLDSILGKSVPRLGVAGKAARRARGA